MKRCTDTARKCFITVAIINAILSSFSAYESFFKKMYGADAGLIAGVIGGFAGLYTIVLSFAIIAGWEHEKATKQKETINSIGENLES